MRIGHRLVRMVGWIEIVAFASSGYAGAAPRPAAAKATPGENWMAAGVPEKPQFMGNWLVSPLKEYNDSGKIFKARVLQRMVPFRAVDGQWDAFSIGRILYTDMEARLEEKQARPLAEQFMKAMGIAKWNYRKQKDAYVFEAEWSKIGKYFRMYIKPDGNRTRIVSATYRKDFAESVSIETELLQRYLTDTSLMPKPKDPWFARVWDQLVPSAHALPCNGMPPLQCLIANANSIEQNSQSVSNSATNISNQISNISGAITNAQGTIKNVGDLAATINSKLGDYENIANQALAEIHTFNNTFSDVSKTIKEVTRPGYIAQAAFVGVLAAGAASLLVNAAGAGLGELLNEIIKAFEDKDPKIMEAFEEARQKYEKMDEERVKIRRYFATNIYMLSLIKEVCKNKPQPCGREQLIQELNRVKGENIGAVERMQAVVDEHQGDTSQEWVCTRDEFNTILVPSVNAGISRIDNILNALKEMGTTGESETALCKTLVDRLNAWARLEKQMDTTRLPILSAKKIDADTGTSPWQRTYEKTEAKNRQQGLDNKNSGDALQAELDHNLLRETCMGEITDPLTNAIGVVNTRTNKDDVSQCNADCDEWTPVGTGGKPKGAFQAGTRGQVFTAEFERVRELRGRCGDLPEVKALEHYHLNQTLCSADCLLRRDIRHAGADIKRECPNLSKCVKYQEDLVDAEAELARLEKHLEDTKDECAKKEAEQVAAPECFNGPERGAAREKIARAKKLSESAECKSSQSPRCESMRTELLGRGGPIGVYNDYRDRLDRGSTMSDDGTGEDRLPKPVSYIRIHQLAKVKLRQDFKAKKAKLKNSWKDPSQNRPDDHEAWRKFFDIVEGEADEYRDDFHKLKKTSEAALADVCAPYLGK